VFVTLLGLGVNRTVERWGINSVAWLRLWCKSSCRDIAWTPRWPGVHSAAYGL